MTIKTCNKCNVSKSLTLFFKDKNNKTDGHHSICKECKQAGTALWRQNNKDKYNSYMRERNKLNYPKARLQRYGLTQEIYKSMLLEQQGLCQMCKNPPKSSRPLVIDHDHKTKKVRGLLCYGCNRVLHAFDNIEVMESALNYLKRHT